MITEFEIGVGERVAIAQDNKVLAIVTITDEDHSIVEVPEPHENMRVVHI